MRQAVRAQRPFIEDDRKVLKQVFRTKTDAQIEYLYKSRPNSKGTIVFFNGWLLRLSEWSAQMPSFLEYNLLFTNNRGHGKSTVAGSTPATYLYDCTRDNIELARHLRIEDPHVIGFSMGALIATEFFHRMHGQVQSITFVAPAVSNPLLTFPLKGPIGRLLDAADGLKDQDAISEIVKNLLKVIKTDPVLFTAFVYFRELTNSGIPYNRFRKYIGDALEMNPDSAMLALRAMIETGDEIAGKMQNINVMNTPTLLIRGEHDMFVTADSIDIMQRCLPQTKVVIFSNATHFPIAEDPERFNRLVHAFINGRLAQHLAIYGQ